MTNQRIKGKKGGYTNKYQFANKQLDEESDLQYFEKRYYDNRIGRFTTEDPVFWEVGLTKRPNQYFTDPQQWNTYSYVRNNPVNLVDPTGEFLDTLWDAANIIYDAGKIVKNSLEVTYEGARNLYGTVTNNQSLIQASQNAWNQDSKELGEGVFDAGVDAFAAAIPFVPAGASKVGRTVTNNISSIGNIASKIANGHAFTKHISEFKNIGITTKEQLSKHVESIIKKAEGTNNMRTLENGRKAYWDNKTGTIVITNPKASDAGTVFRPSNGKSYFTDTKSLK